MEKQFNSKDNYTKKIFTPVVCSNRFDPHIEINDKAYHTKLHLKRIFSDFANMNVRGYEKRDDYVDVTVAELSRGLDHDVIPAISILLDSYDSVDIIKSMIGSKSNNDMRPVTIELKDGDALLSRIANNLYMDEISSIFIEVNKLRSMYNYNISSYELCCMRRFNKPIFIVAKDKGPTTQWVYDVDLILVDNVIQKYHGVR